MPNIRQAIRGRIERDEWHPVQVGSMTIQELEGLVAQLWDEVWWHQLPFYRRWFYYWLGYRSPITKFYAELWKGDSEWRQRHTIS
jgi:hypothetical protein